MQSEEKIGMDAKLLEAFHIVVSNNSITKAAEILGVTQPAVSAQIARLENALGFPLFLRNGGRLALTSEGILFHDEVTHVLGLLQRLDGVAENIREGKAGRLVIASHPSASISLLPELIPLFLKDYPETGIRMINRTSEEVRSLFPAASIDIGIAELPTDIVGVDVQKYILKCVAIVPRDHPAAQKKVITPDDFSGEPFFSMPPERMLNHRIREIFARTGAVLKIIGEVDFFSSICAMVAKGAGVSIVDIFSARMFAPLGLEVRPFDPTVPYEIGVLTSTNGSLSVPAKRFLTILDQALKKEM